MLDVRYSTKFKKDFKLCVKRGYKMPLLQQAIDTLRIPAPLSEKNKDHNLTGNYSGYRELNISRSESHWYAFEIHLHFAKHEDTQMVLLCQ